ncbi:hypothetical protein MP228_003037 [Amoeboaphelidium protococcarum]|nr:hypothetical protein MP228_003037 [Amoeboaphelidium protococcarum]
MSASQLPSGTKLSPTNQLLLTSTGISDLDSLLGGGLPVGSVIAVHEDETHNAQFAHCLVRYFLSQGLVGHNHGAVVFNGSYRCLSADDQRNKVVSECYGIYSSDGATSQSVAASSSQQQKQSGKENVPSKMKIAWRYENLGQINGDSDDQQQQQQQQHQKGSRPRVSAFTKIARSPTAGSGKTLTIGARSGANSISVNSPQAKSITSQPQYCAVFDLSKKATVNDVGDINRIQILDPFNGQGCEEDPYHLLLQQIAQHLLTMYRDQDQNLINKQRVVRIALNSLGSPLFGEDLELTRLCRFLVSLRALVRQYPAVCMITLPSNALQWTQSLLQRVNYMVDAVINVTAYGGEDQSYFSKEYHGQIRLCKLFKLNSLIEPNSYLVAKRSSRQLAGSGSGGSALNSSKTKDDTFLFKCRRRKLCIEQVHLPPEIDDNASRSQGAAPSLTDTSSKSQDW